VCFTALGFIINQPLKYGMTGRYILYVFLLAVAVSCKKEKDANPELLKLPLATQSGANTCGCLVNGKAWIMNKVAPGAYAVDNIGPTFFFNLAGPDSSYLYFVLRGYGSTPAANTKLNIHNGMGWSSFVINKLGYGSTGPENTGVINFTRLDTANKIMAGNFSFSYKSPTGNQQNHPDQELTDCRFDFKYRKF
jgi:hypothetical protein